jgi:hypothetical protein
MTLREKIEDTKWAIRNCNLKDRHCNGQSKTKKKKKTMVNKILHRKLKIEQHEPNLKKTSVNSGSPAG